MDQEGFRIIIPSLSFRSIMVSKYIQQKERPVIVILGYHTWMFNYCNGWMFRTVDTIAVLFLLCCGPILSMSV